MVIIGYNVVLEKFSFAFKTKLDPTVACVAGACQRNMHSQIILQLNDTNDKPGVKERNTFCIHMVQSFSFASKDRCDSWSNYQLNYLP